MDKITSSRRSSSIPAKPNKFFEINDDQKKNVEKKCRLSCCGQGEFIKNGKRYMRIITHDLIRDILIPSQQKIIRETILHENEYTKLNNNKDNTDPFIQQKREEDKKNKMIRESTIRKKELQDFKSPKLNDPRIYEVEKEISRKANITKTNNVAESDEMKTFLSLVLTTKCNAIREAQIEEKKLIENEIKIEDKRLENVMEQERLEFLKKLEEEKNKKNKKREKFIKDITEQIYYNELERETEAERVHEESLLIKEGVIKMQIDELRKIQEKRKKQQKISKEIIEYNEKIKLLTEQQREQAQLEELKIQQYMKKKIDKEEQEERAYQEEKVKKQKLLASIGEKTRKLVDDKEAKDLAKALKTQMQIEVELLNKEKMMIEQKIREEENVKLAREAQLQEKRREEAKQKEIEILESEIQAQISKELQEKDANDLKIKKQLNEKIKANLLKQINEKEREILQNRCQLFEENIGHRIEEKSREEILKKLIKEKISDMSGYNIPEKHLKEMRRQLRIMQQKYGLPNISK